MKEHIRVVIIDDEENNLITVETLLEQYCPEVQVAGKATNIKDGTECIHKTKPDLLFLDIKMPGGGGFELLKSIDTMNMEIVFITAYDEFAIKAFECSAIHYILKPIAHTELLEAVNRFKKIRKNQGIESKIDILTHNFEKDNKKLLLPSQTEMKVIEIRDIEFCESSSHYTIFHLIDKQKIVVTKPLQVYEELLYNYGFYRIHSSYLINLKYIDSYMKGRGGYVKMRNGKKLDVSIRKKQSFLDALNSFLNSA